MKNYDINVSRDGRWWMIEIPSIDGLTQTRRLIDVEQTAREYIAVTLDVRLSTVGISYAHVRLGSKGGHDLAASMSEISEAKRQMMETEKRVSELMRSTAAELSEAEVPVRDIGTILGVSHQRVSQLIND